MGNHWAIETLWVILALSAIVIMPALFSWYRLRLQAQHQDYYDYKAMEGLPEDLLEADLYLNKEEISCRSPYPYKGRVDQVFIKDNTLYILETKTRNQHRVYESDVLQLSLYSYILAHSHSKSIAKNGYIRTVVIDSHNGEKSVCFHLVKLLPLTYIEKMFEENQLNVGGRVVRN